jgi:hypothetical protein
MYCTIPRHSGRNPCDPPAASYRTPHVLYIIPTIRGRNPHDPPPAAYCTLHVLYIIPAIWVEIHVTHRLLHTVPCMYCTIPRHSGRNPRDPPAASYRTLHVQYIIPAIRVEIHMTHQLLHPVPCMYSTLSPPLHLGRNPRDPQAASYRTLHMYCTLYINPDQDMSCVACIQQIWEKNYFCFFEKEKRSGKTTQSFKVFERCCKFSLK